MPFRASRARAASPARRSRAWAAAPTSPACSPNTPDNMVAWLQDPQRIVPGNAMPDLAIGRDDARALAAYLEQLR